MATLYVDQSSDANYTNNGTDSPSTPYFNLHAALLDAAVSGDTVEVAGSTNQLPFRNPYTIEQSFTLNGGIITPCNDVSDGGRWYRHNLETHTQALNDGGWNAVNGTILNNTDNLYGTNCAELVSAGTPLYRRNWQWTVTDQQKFLIVYKCASGSDDIQWGARAESNFWYDEGGSDTWRNDIGEIWFTLPNSTDWNVFITPEIPQYGGGTTGSNFFNLRTTSGNQCFVQYVVPIVEPTWQLDSGTTYRIPYFDPEGDFAVSNAFSELFKSTQADWSSQGYEALRIVQRGVSVVGLNDGEYFYDDSAKLLYYKLESGEVITDLHLEAARNVSGLALGDGYNGFAQTGTTTLWGGQFNLLANGLVSDNAIMNSISTMISSGVGIQVSGEGTVAIDTVYDAQPVPSSFNKEYGGGIIVGQATVAEFPTLVINTGYSLYAGDDAVQSVGGGNLVLNAFCSDMPEANGVELSNDQSGSVISISNFSNRGGVQNAFRDQAPGVINVTLEDCEFYSDGSLGIEFSSAASDFSVYTATNLKTQAIGGAGYNPAGNHQPVADNTVITMMPEYTLPCFNSDESSRNNKAFRAAVQEQRGINQTPNYKTRGDMGSGVSSNNKHTSPTIKVK